MGADLILAATPAPHFDEDVPRADRNSEVEVAVLLQRVRDMSPEQIAFLFSDYMLQGDDDWSEDEAVQRAESAVTTVMASPRDVAWLQVRGTSIIVSGGMSWGDDPSESYSDVMVWEILGISVDPITLDEVDAIIYQKGQS